MCLTTCPRNRGYLRVPLSNGIWRLVLAVVPTLLAACGGDTTPASHTGATSATERLLYSGGVSGLWLVDPEHPTTPVNVAPTANVVTPLYESMQDSATGAITGHRRVAVTYLGADGYFYRFGALTTDPLTPFQISNERGPSLTDPVCPQTVSRVNDSSDYLQSAIFFQGSSPTTSGGCTPNPTKLIRVGMTSTDAPITVAQAGIPDVYSGFNSRGFEPLFNHNGGIAGWLALDGSNLVRCDDTFQTCQAVTSFLTSVRTLPIGRYYRSYGVGSVGVVQIDGRLHTYDSETAALSSPRYTFSTDECPGLGMCRLVILDEKNGYIFDGNNIGQFLIADDHEAVPFLSGEQGTVSIWGLTADYVLYLVEAGTPSTFTIRSIAKTGGVATTIIPPSAERPHLITDIRGRISYQRGSARAFVNEDGTELVETPGSTWAGFIGDRTAWIEDCSPTSCGGGTLIAAEDAETRRGEIVLGTIPSDTPSIWFRGSSIGSGGEIFYADPSRRNSLVQVTNTPLDLETVL